jgi:RNA polymerase primary sigma factor
MGTAARVKVDDATTDPGGASTAPLGPKRERRLLAELAECKRALAAALAREVPGLAVPEMAEDPGAMSRFLAGAYRAHGTVSGTLAAGFRRYFELRTELALANTRLVAHVAKRYRDRGIASSDLIQEGLCGLLEAIDRFDPAHQTKLATYATWWIRQAIQNAVAAGAYPVRLAPRHLRQLARDGQEHGPKAPRDPGRPDAADELIRRIHAATRPAVSLDETCHSSIAATGGPERDRADHIELGEAVGKWMRALRPRERQVLSYRFGLGGSPCLSLSQVGKALNVSKERVRQIQEAALELLRTKASPELLAPTC